MIKKPTKKKWSISESRLDALWSQAVRKKYGNRCAICGYPEGQSHHLIKRCKRVLRWNIDNGIYLCARHHLDAHSAGGVKKIYDIVNDNVLDFLFQHERFTLKDVCTKLGITVDEFRQKCLDRLKEYING